MIKDDGNFAKRVKNILECLYKSENPKEREELYNEGLRVINSKFGTCPRCGHVNTEGKFCSECGQELAGEVKQENPNIESVDYVVASSVGKSLTILSISDTPEKAINSLRKYYSSGVNAEVFKRTLEKVKLF